jgi:hypothetical protein
MVTQQEHDEAVARGLEALRTQPRALSACYDPSTNLVSVELNTGYTISFAPERSQDLHRASPADLSEVELAGVGFGIYFPRIDADLLVSSIAEGRFGNDRWEAAWRTAHPLEERPICKSAEAAEHTEAA